MPADAPAPDADPKDTTTTAAKDSSSTNHVSPPFDIVQTYRSLLASDPDITKPCAATIAVIELLRARRAFTSMETVEIVQAEVARLLASVANPLPLEAGTRVFTQFLLKSLRGQPSEASSSAGTAADEALASRELQAFLDNTPRVVTVAKRARDELGRRCSAVVPNDSVVMIYGGSRAVTAILLHARRERKRSFRVLQVMAGLPNDPAMTRTAAMLREAGISVQAVGFHEVSYAMYRVKHLKLVLVGAQAVVRNGGALSRMGTLTLAKLAKAHNKRFEVAAEIYKMVPRWPALQNLQDVGIRQRRIDKGEWQGAEEGEEEVDHTTNDLISFFLTDEGPMIPERVDREILKYHELDV